MKPDWKTAPEWANWLAMDGNGEWYWFKAEPHAPNSEGDEWYAPIGTEFYFSNCKSSSWRDTKEKRP